MTPFLGGGSAWPLQETVNTTVAPDGTTQTQLDVTLPPGSPTMTPGTYQLDLQPQTNLGAAFAWVEPNSAWATATAPIPIAQFTVMGQGPTLASATNLGLIGPQAQSVSGFIDPANYQSAVALYRFTVPAWPDLAVRRQGPRARHQQPVAFHGSRCSTRMATCWRRAAPAAARAPIRPIRSWSRAWGRARISSGSPPPRNVPGHAGGYDPVIGEAGDRRREPTGWSVPARRLRHADHTSHQAGRLQPGLRRLARSLAHRAGPDLLRRRSMSTGLSVPDRQETALTVVNSSGRSWSISAVSYQSAQNRLSFIFNEALPPGSYSLMAPTQGGLTDLSGRPVGGPLGNPSNVLASWTVAAPTGLSDPSNLGVLWPGLVNVTWDAAVTGTTTLAVGQDVRRRFVVICPGFYGVQTQPGDRLGQRPDRRQPGRDGRGSGQPDATPHDGDDSRPGRVSHADHRRRVHGRVGPVDAQAAVAGL